MSLAFRAILSRSFEEQGTQNQLQYLSGLSRALFPTTFLEIAVFILGPVPKHNELNLAKLMVK